jgi:microcystin degradation protein MlrC
VKKPDHHRTRTRPGEGDGVRRNQEPVMAHIGARIGIAGLQHETNTFAPLKADLQAFQNTPAYPRLPRGAELIEVMQGLNLPIAGFIESATAAGHTLLPGVWGMATPSDRVTDHAFDTIVGMMVDDLRSVLPLDAVYLCLHGAMVTESHEDGEGEILRRVREVVGDDIPLVVSLDLHCNTTEAMMQHADAMVAYRTYPHVDMAETGQAAYVLLDRILRTGERPAKAMRRTDFLISLVWQCSLIPPADRIYADLQALDSRSLWSASFTPGFPPADIRECGPAVFAYADTQAEADAVAEQLLAQVDGARAHWNGTLYTPEDAVAHAMAGYQGRPYIFADTQDNPGAGGASDTVGVLEGMVRSGAEDAVLAMLYDPTAALAAHQAGVGAELSLKLGASSGQPGHAPFAAEVVVDALSDGEFIGTGPMARGAHFRMGPTAVLRIGGVRVIVTSAITQTKDQACLRHIGIDPTQQKIVALKSSVHFRADFQPMAEEVLVVEAPGPNIADHLKMDFKHLRPGLLITPFGPAFER